MKKLLILLILLILPILIFSGVAQTTITKHTNASLDTVFVSSTVTCSTSVDSVTHKYIPPSTGVLIGGTVSGPVTLQSGKTYSGLTIDLKGLYGKCIAGAGVSNVHITNCKIINTTGYAIDLNGCTNITIDNCLISNVGIGVNVYGNSVTIKTNNNQILNINGGSSTQLGHAIFYQGVSGGGNQINYNRIENIAGVAIHPHDQINVYQSNGLPGDSIQVIGNWIRGGQQSMYPTSNSGAAGIVLGDVGGSYQVARNNIIVNPGYVGMQAQGGNHIKMDHNIIVGDSSPNAADGMSWGNWSGKPSSDVIYAYNKVKYIRPWNGTELDYNTGSPGLTMIGNISKANIDASVLPPVIITFK